MSALITVTGITGFVGMRIAAQALNDGYHVRATIRTPPQREAVRALIAREDPTDNLEFVQADLDTARALEPTRQQAIKGD
jgi:nucleoside-diphosphate-sugar epimerase